MLQQEQAAAALSNMDARQQQRVNALSGGSSLSHRLRADESAGERLREQHRHARSCEARRRIHKYDKQRAIASGRRDDAEQRASATRQALGMQHSRLTQQQFYAWIGGVTAAVAKLHDCGILELRARLLKEDVEFQMEVESFWHERMALHVSQAHAQQQQQQQQQQQHASEQQAFAGALAAAQAEVAAAAAQQMALLLICKTLRSGWRLVYGKHALCWIYQMHISLLRVSPVH
jgi:septum formation inhibitor MinC